MVDEEKEIAMRFGASVDIVVVDWGGWWWKEDDVGFDVELKSWKDVRVEPSARRLRLSGCLIKVTEAKS